MKKIPASLYRFIISGGIATCIDFVCYMLFLMAVWPSIAKAVSMLLANVWSYNVNKKWVFISEKATNVRSIGLYTIVQGANLAINVGVNSLMLYLTGIVILSFIIATLCATIVNYKLQHSLVF